MGPLSPSLCCGCHMSVFAGIKHFKNNELHFVFKSFAYLKEHEKNSQLYLSFWLPSFSNFPIWPVFFHLNNSTSIGSAFRGSILVTHALSCTSFSNVLFCLYSWSLFLLGIAFWDDSYFLSALKKYGFILFCILDYWWKFCGLWIILSLGNVSIFYLFLGFLIIFDFW